MTVLLVDNLQWADPSLRDQLGCHRAHAVGPAVPARHRASAPTPTPRWPPPVERPLVLQVPLGPLIVDDATALVCGILERGDAEPPSDGVADARRPRRRQPAVPRRAGRPGRRRAARAELPGSLRALIAARIDQLPAAAAGDHRQRRRARHRRLDRLAGALRRGDGPGVPPAATSTSWPPTGCSTSTGRWWRFRSAVVREVAYQTLTKRVRAQRHAGVAAVMAERGASIDDVAHHAATAAELLAELGTVDGVKPDDHRARHRGAAGGGHGGPRHRPPRAGASATPAGRSTSTRADPTVERELLLVRAEAELERRNVRRGRAPTPSEVLERRAGRRRPTATRARPAAGSAPSPRCRATWRRRGASSARRSTCSATIGDERRLADALRARGLRRGVRRLARRRPLAARRGDGHLSPTSTTSAGTPGRTRTWRGSPSRPATSTTPRCSSSRPSSASRSSATPTA